MVPLGGVKVIRKISSRLGKPPDFDAEKWRMKVNVWLMVRNFLLIHVLQLIFFNQM